MVEKGLQRDEIVFHHEFSEIVKCTVRMVKNTQDNGTRGTSVHSITHGAIDTLCYKEEK